MTELSRKFLLCASAGCLLAGCAVDADRYPSLAIRDAERFQGEFQVSPPDVTEPPESLASTQDITALVDRASESHRAFVTAQSSVARSVSGARGAAVGSEAHASALVALADLTTLRGATASALGDLDRIAADSATAFAPYEEVAAARALVLDLVSEEDRALDNLWRELKR